MIELAIYLPNSEVKYLVWIGHGSPHHGQTPWFSLTREYYSKGQVVHADFMASLGGKNNGNNEQKEKLSIS